MLNTWMLKGTTFSSICPAIRCILRSNLLAPSRQFHETFRNTSKVMSTQEVNLNPPDSVRGDGIGTCGIIVIGDEVLKGQVADKNVKFLAPRLHALGIKLKKVSIIADLVEEIAKEVAQFSRDYDSVITTGGIGPTHDDLTYEGIAAAFNEPLVLSPEIVHFWSFLTKDPAAAKSSTAKFATVPSSSRLLYPQVSEGVVSAGQFPVVVVRNVVVLPGVPSFVQAIFRSLEGAYFRGPGRTFHGRTIYLKVTEENITECLNDAVKNFSPAVQFGSYPKFGNHYFKVQLTLESEKRSEVERAHSYLMSRLDQAWVAKDGDLLGNAYLTLSSLMREPGQAELARVLHESIEVVEKCLDQYESEELFLSFNGGKDCTALLHLVHSVLVKRHGPRPYPRLTAVYFRPRNPFREVEDFIHETAARYNLNLITEESEIREGLDRLMKGLYRKWKACLLGVRRADPKCAHLSSFQATDEGWPPLTRVCPLLDWTYQDVWTFLRHLSVPYCSLYDRGYTSLGNAQNTRPNPALEYVDEDGHRQFRAAHTLQEETMERNGRVQEQVRHTTP